MSRKSDETRERILTAALAEFSEKGPDGARVNLIAERAGINKERLYAYFGNKDRLFAAVLQRAFDELAACDESLQSLSEDDLPDLPARLLRHNAETHRAHPHLWRLLAWENLTGGAHLDSIRNLESRGYEHLRRLYKSGQKRGLFRREASFEAFLLLTIGVPFFARSNRITMSATLQAPLDDEAWLDARARELAALVKSPAPDNR